MFAELRRLPWLACARFVFKHAVATTAVWVGCAALIVVAYFALFVHALFPDGGLGSPLALPFFVLVAALFGIAVCVCICFPATVFAEALRRWRRWRLPWEIPLVVLPLVSLVVLFAYLNRTRADPPQPDVFWSAFGATLGVLLLAYWCALQSVELAFWLVGRVWRAVMWPLDE